MIHFNANGLSVAVDEWLQVWVDNDKRSVFRYYIYIYTSDLNAYALTTHSFSYATKLTSQSG